jgi:signal transduction histidine kinase
LLFAALAVGPLATVGILDYLRSERLVERLVIAQTDTVAHRAAKVIADRYALVASDVLLLGENAEVQRLIAELARGDSSSIRVARAAADDYLRSVWRLAENTYSSAELRDSAGTVLWRAGDYTPGSAYQDDFVVTEPMREARTGRVVGSVVLTPRPNVLWSRDALGPSFGRTGYGAIIDRRASRVVAHTSASVTLTRARELFGKEWSNDSARIEAPSGWLVYRERDSVRTASFVSLTTPPWTILSSTVGDEFADGFLQARRADIALLVLLIGVVAAAFAFFISRATRSLEALTRAAADVGRGNLSPSLPPSGPDEVGTLSGAFAEMTSRIGSMMREVEVSRQLAVLGEFAAQLSHEVRNPLTSLKLDLQGLQRQVRSGALPKSAEAPVASSLREVNRLDTVVRGVLELARQSGNGHRHVCLDEVIDHSLTALRAQLAQRNVVVERGHNGASAQLVGDPELLSGMFMNLLINAAEAQPDGGRVGVSSVTRRADGREWVDVTIADDGPGVAAERRHDVFRPFYTSRHDGTGLGLALALRTARDHGGHIACEAAADGFRGAAFVVSLPVPAA